jgi:hypothetical protein
MLGWFSDARTCAFRLKSSQAIRVGRESVGQDLQRIIPFEPRMSRSPHLAHAPFANQDDEFISA